jgi:RHS repeat-associated protein
MVHGGTTYRIVSDWRGSVRAVVDVAAGTIVESIDYDAWGNVTSFVDSTCAGGPSCFYFQPFGFAGGLFGKDTGLVRFGARDYDPSVGRWTQKDGTGFGGGTNVYAYANEDPVNFYDPSGRWAIPCALGIANGLAAGVVNAALEWSKQVFQVTVNAFCDGSLDINWGAVIEAGVNATEAELAFGMSACFTAGTLITTCDGALQPIETLREGDLVLSRNPDSGEVECKLVVRTFEHLADDVAKLELSAEDGREETLEVTLGHPFWVEGAGGRRCGT